MRVCVIQFFYYKFLGKMTFLRKNTGDKKIFCDINICSYVKISLMPKRRYQQKSRTKSLIFYGGNKYYMILRSTDKMSVLLTLIFVDLIYKILLKIHIIFILQKDFLGSRLYNV